MDFEPWDGKRPTNWYNTELGEVSILNAGGDKPILCTSSPTPECNIPIYSNGIDNFGLYGYTDHPKIFEESVTVSARGTIGYICLRQDPFFPIVRLITVIPNKNILTAKYMYLYLKNISIAGVGTTQQQLTVPDFKKYNIIIPSLEIINKFTEITYPIFDKIKYNREESARLATLRDTLLPRLMSGELRVSDIEPSK